MFPTPDASTIHILMSKFIVGLLIFVRITGMFITAPMFRSMAIIPQVKIFLAILLATVMTNQFWIDQPNIEFHLWNIVVLVLKELTLGSIIGFAANMVFNAARMAGGLIDFEMGFQAATLFDPMSSNPTLFGELKELLALMIFFLLNGHLQLIETIFVSIRAVPLTTMGLSNSFFIVTIKIITTVFILAIKIAAPVLMALFCTNLALALLARVAPQTNIFIISFQMKVAVGLLIYFALIPMLFYVLKWALSQMQEQTLEILLTLYPGRT